MTDSGSISANSGPSSTPKRGEIYNRQRASQLIDFSGLRFGNITPTNIDGFIDFWNRAFVILEYKRGDNDMPYGQRLALQRMADRKDVPTYVLVGRHENGTGDIDGGAAILTEVYYAGRWRKVLRRRLTIKDCCDLISAKHGLEANQ